MSVRNPSYLFLPVFFVLFLPKAVAQDTIHSYLSTNLYFVVQGHRLPGGTFTYNLKHPDETPTKLSQNLKHKGPLLYGAYIQIHWNHRKIFKKHLPPNLEMFTAFHLAYLGAPGSTMRSGRITQVELGLREGIRYYVHPNVYVGTGILVPVGFSSVSGGDADIHPVSFGGEVVSGPVRTRLSATMIGTHPQLQVGYVAKRKGRTKISLELGGGYLFWHTLRQRAYMERTANNVVVDETQFWIKDFTFNGKAVTRKDFNRSGPQIHAGLRFYFM